MTVRTRWAPSSWRDWLSGLAGLAGGAVAGGIVTLGLVVARARLDHVYTSHADELVGWVGLPLVLGPLVGAWIGVAHPPGRSVLPWSAFGLMAGGVLGAALGVWIGDDPARPWSGAVMGGALGLLVGVWVALLRHLRRRRRALEEEWELGPRRPIFVSLVATVLFLVPLAVLVALSGALSSDVAVGDGRLDPPPDSAEVAAVVLFLGDTGLARLGTHPVLPRVRAEVDRWAGRLGDSAVVVVVLGDVVYPDGVDAPGSPGWGGDSARVADQTSLVTGPVALKRGARILFTAGNHDWGEGGGDDGLARIERLAALVGTLSGAGPAARLMPAPGTGGPEVLDVGSHLRLVLLDTAWWLFDQEPAERQAVLDGVARALAGARGRRVVLAAHHPYRSAGPHGGITALGQTLGIRTLLSRSGALLQDLHSRPYFDLVRGLRAAFAEHGAPELFAGGHEHSLQVLRGASPDEPHTSVVSGSASKLSGVGPAPGLLFARSAPGFARLLVLEDGGLHLAIEATAPEHLSCPGVEPVRVRCMADGVQGYRVVWSADLTPPP
jgi:hypothetical protein